MVGMSRTFLAAGVPLVVATLWQVASDQAADLMIDFHRRRTRDHLSTAAALRQAQLNMIGGDSRFKRPYYWAAFVPIGGYSGLLTSCTALSQRKEVRHGVRLRRRQGNGQSGVGGIICDVAERVGRHRNWVHKMRGSQSEDLHFRVSPRRAR